MSKKSTRLFKRVSFIFCFSITFGVLANPIRTTTFTYDKCTGYIKLTYNYDNIGCGTCDDDHLNWGDFYYKNTSGSWVKFFSAYGSASSLMYFKGTKSGGYDGGNDVHFEDVYLYDRPSDIKYPLEFMFDYSWSNQQGQTDATDVGKHYSSQITYQTIDAPTGLTATDGTKCAQIDLKWNVPTQLWEANANCGTQGAYTYDVYADGTFVANTSSTSISFYSNSGTFRPIIGTKHNFEVKTKWTYTTSFNLFGVNTVISTFSLNSTSANVDGRTKAPPSQPSNFQVTKTKCDGTIDLNWEWNSETPKDFVIRRGTVSGSLSVLKYANSSTRIYIDTISRGVQYFYSVSARNSCNDESGQSSTDGLSPLDPAKATALSLIVLNDTSVNIRWTDNANNETKYVIERRDDQGGLSSFNANKNATSFIDNRMASCRRYSYKVKVIGECTPDGLLSDGETSGLLPPPNLGTTFSGNKKLTCSKGYFNNRIELSWSNNNNSLLNNIYIFRKVSGTSLDSVQIQAVTPGSGLYIDNTADAGVFYKYTIVGAVLCNGSYIYSNVSSDIGYRSPTATITGNVQYAGGVSVDSVQILLEKTSGSTGYASNFSGANMVSVPHSASISPTAALSIEAWVKFGSLAGNPVLFEKANAYKLMYNSTTSNFEFTVYGLTTTTLTASSSAVLLNNYHHIAAVYTGTRLQLFIDGASIGSSASTGSIAQNTSALVIGKSLNGKMDEIRVWNKSRTVSDVALNYNRILNGDETGLALMFHADENSGNFLYDQSKTGTVFNKNDGQFSNAPTWSLDIPSSDQLGYIGITNAQGNYTISGIRYNGTGENFTITPIYLTHEFSPGVTAVFIGDNSTVQNGINFIDKSSFQVTGYVTYSNSTCPAKGVFLKIDNKVVVGADNNVISTDKNGFYDLQVPIGKHFISVESPNHVFSKGRWPDTSTYDFQKPLTRIDFVDDTYLRVVGRVVGGSVQAGKKPGLNKSKNNIGVASLTFTKAGGCHVVAVNTNDTSGEYLALLHPLIYDPEVEVTNNQSIDFGTLAQLNMEGNFPVISVRDTTFITGSKAIHHVDSTTYHKVQNYVHYTKPILSVFDNANNKTFIGDTVYEYTNPKTLVVTKTVLNSGSALGTKGIMKQGKDYALRIKAYELYINYDLPVTRDSIPVTNGSIVIVNNLADTANRVIDLTSIKQMANFNPEIVYPLVYRFKGGNPNFNTNPGNPSKNYKQDLSIILNTNWSQPLDPYLFDAFLLGALSTGNEFFTKGPEMVEFILRDPPGNASFSTREIGSSQEYSESYEWDAGANTHTEKVIAAGAKFSTGLGVSVATDIEANIVLGADISIKGGKSGEVSYTSTNTKSWNTNSSASKPGAPSDLFIGQSKNVNFSAAIHLALLPDTAIARLGLTKLPNQTNLGNGYSLVSKAGLAVTPGGYNTGFMYTADYIETVEIPKLETLRNGFLSGTYPEYTSKITNKKDPRYGLNNDDPIFGTLATPEPKRYTFQDHKGASYTFDTSKVFQTDTIRYFNQQIRLWKEALALNEYEKVIVDIQAKRDSAKNAALTALEAEYLDVKVGYILLQTTNATALSAGAIAGLAIPGAGFATYGLTLGTVIGAAELENKYNEYLNKKKNINDRFADSKANKSISGGVEYSDSQTFETLVSTSSHVEYALSPYLKNNITGKVNGSGVELENSITMELTKNHSSSQKTTETKTISYVIKDEDLKDNFSVDIFPSILGYGPIFKLKPGGATKCPHEDVVKTKYYKPGTIVSEATRQREVPQINVLVNSLKGIPDGEAAAFNITLSNKSFDPFPQEYIVYVDQISNPNGANATFSNTGAPEIVMQLGKDASVNLTLTVSPGANGILKYDSIRVIAASTCQNNYLDGEKVIADTIYVSAQFIPTCSHIETLNLENNWVSNVSANDTISVAIGKYNINKYGMEHLQFEYKQSADADYKAVEAWYKPGVKAPTPTSLRIPLDKEYLDFNWVTSSLPDGNYDIKLTSYCSVYGDTINKIITESDVYSGLIDRINPHPFGTPSPGDGILDPGEDISIRFNEPIDLGSLTKNFNFDIRGVLNNSAIRHSTSLLFDGIKDYVEVSAGADLQKRSFTLEFWAKMNGNNSSEQAIISQGTESTQSLFIGFDSNGKFLIRFGSNAVATNNSITDRTDWKHYAISCTYNPSTSFTTVGLYVDGVLSNTNNSQLNLPYLGSGKLFFGKEGLSNSKFYKGNLHEMRLWNNSRARSSIVSTMSSNLSTNTTGLLYNWKMDEAIGNFAKDIIRSRNAVVYGPVWQLDPLGYSASFDGQNDYVGVKIPRSSITKEMDFTLEFWFNSSSKSTTNTLFSNGKGDGLGSDSLYAWNIQNDNNGLLHVYHKGVDFIATNKDYFDGQWHHFALVMKRSNTLSAFVDGNLENSIFAKKFAELSCDSLYFGSRRYYNGTIQSSDNYYNGKLDEVRFWNTAREQEQINRDKQFSLLGDEAGLKLYLPFELYSVSNRVLESSIKNTTSDLSVASNAFGGLLYTQSTPSIKLPREVEQIEFTFALNVDEIIITPTTLPALIENVKLDITVKDVRDLNKNIMSSPKTWIAYINKNQVKWQEQEFSIDKLVSEIKTFDATVVNTGGELKSFVIGNMPSWLSASTTSGVVAPNSYVTVHFTIDETENIGYYEEDLTLTTNFGYPEKLTIKLKNSAKAPNWNVNASNFQYSQGVISQIKIDDIISTNAEDMVAAFVGNDCRGVTKLKYYPDYDRYFAVLDIYSNSTTSELVTFRIWNAAEGKEHSDVTPVITFSSDSVNGDFRNPVYFEATDKLNRTLPLKTGWNWISVNVACSDSMNINNFLKSLSSSDGDLIKGQSSFADFSTINQWVGSLNTEGIKVESSYRLKLSKNDTLVFKGRQIDPLSRKITTRKGWNWIGFVSLRNQSVQEALGNLSPVAGEVIKAQSRFAIYDTILGWSGSLTTLEPNKGYMYKALKPANFTYPLTGIFARLEDVEDVATKWTVDETMYEFNMNYVAKIECGVKSNDHLSLGAFVGTECRGVIPVSTDDRLKGIFYLTIFSNTNGEKITLKLIDELSGNIVELENSLSFVNNDIQGTTSSPILLSASSGLDQMCDVLSSIDEKYSNNEIASIKPVPFTNQFKVSLNMKYSSDVNFVVRNVNSQVVYKKDFGNYGAGNHEFELELENKGLASGIYFVEVVLKSETLNFKTIKR